MKPERNDSKNMNSVTTGLSAVEALTKAKNEVGYAMCGRDVWTFYPSTLRRMSSALQTEAGTTE
jgi:hypothetical protein